MEDKLFEILYSESYDRDALLNTSRPLKIITGRTREERNIFAKGVTNFLRKKGLNVIQKNNSIRPENFQCMKEANPKTAIVLTSSYKIHQVKQSFEGIQEKTYTIDLEGLKDLKRYHKDERRLLFIHELADTPELKLSADDWMINANDYIHKKSWKNMLNNSP